MYNMVNIIMADFHRLATRETIEIKGYYCKQLLILIHKGYG